MSLSVGSPNIFSFPMLIEDPLSPLFHIYVCMIIYDIDRYMSHEYLIFHKYKGTYICIYLIHSKKIIDMKFEMILKMNN